MKVSRRRVLQALALTGTAAEGAEQGLSVDALRHVSAAHGTNLSDDRLRVVQPVVDRRLTQLRALREFEFDDAVEPTEGILSGE
jgi:hypothetical protein